MHSLIDEISEIVYVADMKNYDLLFLNRTGKRMLNIEHIQGLKCYHILKGRQSPCDFCMNDRLNEKAFYSWKFQNSVTGRHYILRDKLILWNGKKAHMEVALDITEQEEQRQVLEETLRVEQVILDCVKVLHRMKHPKEAVDLILAKAGTFLQADRTYIFEIDGECMDNTWEWCAPGVQRQMDRLQRIPLSLVDRWMDHFQRGEYVFIEDVEALKEREPDEYQTLAFQDIRSLMVAPLELDGKLMGFIGVDNPARENRQELSAVLDTLAYFLAAAIEKMRTKDMLNKASFFDALTGLYNRNRFIRDMDASKLEIRRALLMWM